MAYLDLDTHFAAPCGTRNTARVAAAAPVNPAANLAADLAADLAGDAADETAGFSALEWSVIALAKRDTLRSLASPGPVSRAMGGLFGLGSRSQLADPRLEALRRMAVYAWRRGFALPMTEIRAFLAAGFVEAQMETLVVSVTGMRVGATTRAQLDG
jgi:hypothetical protein